MFCAIRRTLKGRLLMTKEPRTAFISYTRQGGAATAERVRHLLATNDIKPWQDRTHIRGGEDFWQQIERAIRRCSYLVMVLTPDAFGEERHVLRREWYTARSAGTCVVPIKGIREMNLADNALPRWLKSRHIVDLDQPAELNNLIAQLQSECRVERVPFMADDLPENFTPRAELSDALLALLRGDESRVAPIALSGPGGFGKTMLAQAICHDDRVIASFEHGILWATLGEQPRILDKLSMLFTALTDEQRTFTDQDAARVELADRLRSKRCLIVVDDVWNYADLEPFLHVGRESVRLITTRQASMVAQANAANVSVDKMTTAEAVAMLAASLPQTLSRSSLTDMARRLGEWPVLLNLFAGHVRESLQYGQSAAEAVTDLLTELKELGPTAFDWANANDRRQAVDLTLGVSLRRLSAVEKVRCTELSIFPEAIPIPLAVVSDLWHVAEVETRRTLRRFADLGLINLDLATRSIGIHNVIGDYLSRQLERPEADVHAKLIDSWPDAIRLPHEYAWRWYAHHLAKAGRIDELRRLLTNPVWLATKLEKHGLGALVDDYDYLGERDVVRLVQSALMMDAQSLALNRSQLPTQLLSRLGRGIAPEIDRLIEDTLGFTSGPWLRPLQSTLPPPGGALVRVMRGYAAGHEGTVRSIAMDPHGRWAMTAGNSAQDQAVIIWNLRSGSHRKLPGQAKEGGYTPLAMTSDGTAAVIGSGSDVRLVGTTDGNEIAAHSRGDATVTAIALSSDGKTATWGTADGVVWMWSFADGPPRLLGQHAGPVEAIDMSRDACVIASATADEVKLWALEESRALASVEGAGFMPKRFCPCFRITDDGSVLWASAVFIERNQSGWTTYGRAALKRWDPNDPKIRMLQHLEVSEFLAVSENGRRVLVTRVRDGSTNRGSGSEDLALYELGDAPRLVTLPKLGRDVSTAVISADARWAATADFEHDLFVWDLDRAVAPLPQPAPALWHDMTFSGFSTSGHAAVFETAEGVVTSIDVEAGAAVRNAPVPEIWRNTPEPRSATRDADRPGETHRVRPPRASGKASANDYPVDDFGRSRGHTATVKDRRRAPNGRWEVTVSHDGTARVWELAGDRPLATFTSDSGLVQCHWSPDSRTLAVIDSAQPTHLLRLEGV
jgi:WD40 repeat protein